LGNALKPEETPLPSKRIALGSRLRRCKNVMTLGVRTNLSGYEDWQLELIRKSDVICYPTAFYADIFDTIGKRTFPNYHTYKYAMDKIKQTALFNLLKIPHPRTRVFYGNHQKTTILDHLQFPFRMPPDGILTPGSQRREEVLFPGI